MMSKFSRSTVTQLCKVCTRGRNLSAKATTTDASSVNADLFFSRVPAPSPFKHGEHRSNAEKLISEVPITRVAAGTAICDGGGGVLGHPVEYIQLLGLLPGMHSTCKYCGLRFAMAEGKIDHH